MFLCITCVLKVFPKSQICFVKKLQYKHFRECFASKASCTQVTKMRRWISISSKILHRDSCNSLASHSREMASRETTPVHLRHFVRNSRVPREYLSCKMSRFSVFKEAHSDSFSNILFCLPRVSLNPKHSFHSNLNQNSMDFIPKTSLRYVLTLFIF